MSAATNDILGRIQDKFRAMDQDPDVHMEGLVWARPITYWDYIHTDALLSLQLQRTTLPDEMVFIMYHQINELLFRMILWEIDQVAHATELTTAFFAQKLERASRYFDTLAMSFEIMGKGMDRDQYLKFRNTLTPASGFQSAQYRIIEFASTEVLNIVDARYRKDMPADSTMEDAYNLLYWHAAGKDHKTGKSTTLIRLFEERYKAEFLNKMEGYRHTNLWSRYKQLPETERSNADLVAAMRHYDLTVNVVWVMAHYNAAAHYLDNGDKAAEGTGGSDWRKYMHPKYQRRIFFPDLWSAEELANWGCNV